MDITHTKISGLSSHFVWKYGRKSFIIYNDRDRKCEVFFLYASDTFRSGNSFTSFALLSSYVHFDKLNKYIEKSDIL